MLHLMVCEGELEVAKEKESKVMMVKER